MWWLAATLMPEFILLPETERNGTADKDRVITGEPSDGGPLKSGVLLFALAFLLAPMVILLHECGHYVVHYFQGHHPVLYSSEVEVGKSPVSGWCGQMLSALGGPMVEGSLCVGGFIWLKRRRRGHLDAAPTALDWLATFMAMSCGRWIHHAPDVLWGHYRTGRYGSDEAGISMLLGLPGWVLPVALWFPACWVFITTIRQHPKSRRLVPFSAMFLGGASGALLWLMVVGPAVLGHQPAPFRLLPKVASPPKVVWTAPANGATVAPGLTELRVTFDRPMMDGSWAWCGDGPHFPEAVGRPRYNDSHTVWSVHVKLKPEWVYAFALNSDPRYKGFMSEEGAVLAPLYVTFETRREEAVY